MLSILMKIDLTLQLFLTTSNAKFHQNLILSSSLVKYILPYVHWTRNITGLLCHKYDSVQCDSY
jgi:hypothetical protein